MSATRTSLRAMTVVTVAAAFLLGVLPGWSPPPAHAQVAPKLVIGQNFPDPDVLQVGSSWYAYATNTGGRNVPVATAGSPDGPWTVRTVDAMPNLGAWASEGKTWAPDVSRRTDGKYLLYYTARHTASGRQCIGAGIATSPLGPFQPVGTGPLVCNPGEGGDIDASSFVDSDGTRYLLYKNDGNAIGVPTWVYLQQVASNGTSFVGGRTGLIRNDKAEEHGVIEAPVLVRRPSQYVLFYAGGCYCNNNYFTSYAASSTLRGTYTKAYRPLMTTQTFDGAVRGPGGADALSNRIIFHGWINSDSARGMYVADLGWANDYPVVRGSRVRYEAERGRLNHCQVRTGASGASQGAVVAYIDYADSWAEVRVYAASAGNHSVHVGYANGSAATATHTLRINGGSPVVVNYPVTGWDNWRQVRVDVNLAAGWNTLRFTHRDRYAELDYIEVS
ncbi:MAG: family 43 glycosylhydrolase [Micromonosporaceae bacterium]